MNDLQTLQRDLLAQVDAATDEATLENLRISALGKKGSVSELLKTLGRMSPEERKEKGPVINGLRDTVQNAILSRRDALADAALEARLSPRGWTSRSPCVNRRRHAGASIQSARSSTS
jgi:phenylalanyl-tRNA synthetase alpha chain